VGPDNVPAAEHLAEHAAVLALRHAVVVATSQARLGELGHAQLLQQRGHLVVDLPRAVVGVEALHCKGVTFHQTFRDRRRKVLGDALHAAVERVPGGASTVLT